MSKFVLAIAVVCLVSACGKTEEAKQNAAPTVTESQKADALRQFTDRKPAKVRSLAEIQADEKAKSQGATNGSNK